MNFTHFASHFARFASHFARFASHFARNPAVDRFEVYFVFFGVISWLSSISENGTTKFHQKTPKILSVIFLPSDRSKCGKSNRIFLAADQVL
jgi:hypothetical protein